MVEKVSIRRLRGVSVNERALSVLREMMQRADSLDVDVLELKNGTTVVDAGVNASGGYGAAEYATRVALCGYGEARITAVRVGEIALPALMAYTDLPAVIAISFYVWPGVIPPPHAGEPGFKAWVSGPGKARVQFPDKVYSKLDYRDEGDVAVLVVQPRGRELPDESVAERLAEACGVDPSDLYLLVTPSSSVAGSAQVSARTMEDGFWRLTEFYGISYDRVEVAMTVTPISPTCDRVFLEPTPWADDMIRHGGFFHAWVRSVEGEDLQKMAEEMVVENNPASFGKSFYRVAVVERAYIHPDYDLERVAREGRGFVVAEVCLYDLRTGRMYRAGRLHGNILEKVMTRPW